MGQTLSEPVTEKESAYCQNENYRVGSSCMQGWRIRMEDSHTHILSLPDDPKTSFFAVYDGHGGANVAQYAGKHLHKFITQRPEYKSNNIEQAMKQAFLDIDDAMLNDEALRDQMAGSTAVTCLIKDNKLYCANAGDSRAIACIDGKLEILSLDHKPNNDKELKRICDGGGYVEYNRVNGNLALSRALGDFVFKRNAQKIPEEQIVTAYPDVEIREITEDWEFVILACDGIWDVISNEYGIEFCRARIAMGSQPEEICEELMSKCLSPDVQMGGLGGDNMTVVLICFLHGKSYEDLVNRCASSMLSTKSLSGSPASSTTSLSSPSRSPPPTLPPIATTTTVTTSTTTETTTTATTTTTTAGQTETTMYNILNDKDLRKKILTVAATEAISAESANKCINDEDDDEQQMDDIQNKISE